MADFFVLLRQSEDYVRRLEIQRDLQNELKAQFRAGAAKLRSLDRERIPLSNEAYTPDETEVWCVKEFELPEELAAAVTNPIGCAVLDQSAPDLAEIRAILASYREAKKHIVAFQAFSRNQILSRSGLSIVLSRNTFKKLKDPGLTVTSKVDGVLESDTFLFSNLRKAAQIVSIAEYYSEATDADIDEFVSHSRIFVSDSHRFRSNADQWIRKRIALIQDSGVLDVNTPRQVREKAAQYNLDINVKGTGKSAAIVIPEDSRAVKSILKFLEEDYYEGPLSSTRYVANSKRKL